MKQVEKLQGGRGRNADVHLYNGVTVSWDPYSQTVWAEGPLRHCKFVESYLRGRYETRGLKRACVTGYYVATRFMRAPLHRFKDSIRAEHMESEQATAVKPTPVETTHK